MIAVRVLGATAGRRYLDDLAAVLVDCVDGGASVSFLAPLSRPTAVAFFETVLQSVDRGERLLLAAFLDSQLVGTVQILLDTPPNQPHRADIAKLLIARSARGQGIAGLLMRHAEDQCRVRHRTLLCLDTATDSTAEKLYRRLGWTAAGSIPNYALLPNGQLCATTIFWKQLE